MTALLAYAVIREDPPVVYAAEDLDVLHRVLALEVVAQTPPARFPPGVADRVREALLDERWGDAVVGWIDATGIAVDVYGDLEVWTADRLAEPDLAAVELQMTPLFGGVAAVPELKTEISELVTGLGMLGYRTVDAALDARPAVLRNVADASWFRVRQARAVGAHDGLFAAAWDNGRVFLAAADGLRGREPAVIEWKGPSRPVGYEAVPADLRVDHVFLISCKHRSRILHNVAPAHLFDRALAARRGDEVGSDWFEAVAPAEYQALFEVTASVAQVAGLPAAARDLDGGQRRALSLALRETRGWPPEAVDAYADLCRAVSGASAARWNAALPSETAREEQLWRLLRLSSVPYFVLGAAPDEPLRLRIATPWDWRQHWRFLNLDVRPDPFARQPMVRWAAQARHRETGEVASVEGFVEIRWSHGRFGGYPEAKVQLVTAHGAVPGYVALV